MNLLLPNTKSWITSNGTSGIHLPGLQTLSIERYWLRAVNEAIDPNQTKDQEVLRDIQSWMNTPNPSQSLIARLTSNEDYCNVFDLVCKPPFRDSPDRINLLCEHVVQHICSHNGPLSSADFLGFTSVFNLHELSTHDIHENSEWLKKQMSSTVTESLAMTYDLWNFYASEDISFIHSKSRNIIRQHMLEAARREFTSGSSLARSLSPQLPAALLHYVFDTTNKENPTLDDTQSWMWLGPVILEGLRNKSVAIAANCVYLLKDRSSAIPGKPINTDTLEIFFGDNALETITLLGSMIDLIPEPVQIQAREIVSAGYEHLNNPL